LQVGTICLQYSHDDVIGYSNIHCVVNSSYTIHVSAVAYQMTPTCSKQMNLLHFAGISNWFCIGGYCIAAAPDPCSMGLLVCKSQHWNSSNLI